MEALTLQKFRGFITLTHITKYLLGAQLVCSLAITVIYMFKFLMRLNLIVKSETAEGFVAMATCLFGLINLVFFFLTGIVFLVWVYKANQNARKLCDGFMKFTPGWSVGWYFVPILNLWKPFQAMVEIWRVSETPSGLRSSKRPPILELWWGLYIISAILANAGLQIGFSKASSASVANQFTLISDALMASSDLMVVIMNIVVISIIGKICSMQLSHLEKKTNDSFISMEEAS